MTIRLLFVLLLSFSAWAASVHAQAPLPSIEERAFIASQLYAGMQTHFAHWETAPEVDLEDAYRAYLGAALGAPDRYTFTLESQAFLAQFGNGHTLFIDRALFEAPVGAPLGFSLRHIDHQWVTVTSEVSGLEVGDVVRAVNDEPMEAFYATVRRYLPASTDAWARRVLFASIPGFYSGGLYFPKQFTLTLDDGRTVFVDRSARPSTEQAPRTEGRWLIEGQMAYVRIPSFQDPVFEADAVALLADFADAETVILDVRGNGGGSTPTRLHEALMERPYRWWAGSTPMAPALHQSYAAGGNGWYGDFRRPHLSWPAQTLEPGADPYQGHVFLLVDAGCHSACEDFVMPFKDNGRGVLVGERTAGSSGQPHMLSLGNDMMALIGAKRERFPDGSIFEGVGIEPDVVVPLMIEDVRTGRDPVLEWTTALAGRDATDEE